MGPLDKKPGRKARKRRHERDDITPWRDDSHEGLLAISVRPDALRRLPRDLAVRKQDNMKLNTVVVFALIAFAIGCGSGSSSGSASGVTQLAGHWTITVSTTTPSFSGSVFHVNLVSGPCTIQTAAGVFGEDSDYCYIADTQVQGSISETGSYFYPPYAVLVESYANSVSNGPIAFGITFIEADPNQYGDLAVFAGLTGTLTGDGMTGTWMCAYAPSCMFPNGEGGMSSLGGTFTGNN